MQNKHIVVYRRPKETASEKTGLGRYADAVEQCLDLNMGHDTVYVNASSKNGLFDMIKNGLLVPIKSALKYSSADTISHAADEFCSIVFPFTRGRKIVTVHHVVKKGESSKPYRLIWNIITRVGLRMSDAVIAISEPTFNDIVEMGVSPSKIRLISNAVDPKFRTLNVPKKRIAGCVCELIPRKNVSDSVKAFDSLVRMPGMEDFKLIICGKGAEKQNLLALIDQLKLNDKVEFVTDLNDDDIVEFYNSCSVMFNTSLHEGLGFVTIETQRCGTPILHLKGAAIPKNVTKYSIECDGPDDMAGKTYDLISDREAYEKLRTEAKEYAESFGSEFDEKYLSALLGKDE